jgi:fructoselysine-6-P-deglycase FrlB-like protein
MSPGALTLQDIARTPAVLDGLADRAPELKEFTHQHLTPDPGGRLFVYGCGDGLVAAEAVASRAIVAVTALDMLAYRAPELTPADRVLAVSMSGNVDRGVEAAAAVASRGGRLALLTNAEGGQLGATGAPRFSLAIPTIKHFLCGTATYTGTLFALMQIAACLAGGAPPPSPSADLVGLAARVADGLAKMTTAFSGVRFLSAGPNRATASHGCAKLVELTRLPTWSADIEEFAHSQFWSATPDELIVFIVTNPAIAALANHAATVLGDMGFTTLAFAAADTQVPASRYSAPLPAMAEAMSPLVAATAVQVLAWHLCLGAGLDPDTRAHLKDDAIRFSTSRRLTRHALVGTGR